MKVLLIISLIVVVKVTALTETESHWNVFKLQHGKSYRNLAEETKRFAIFQDNLHKINEHNAKHQQGLKSYKLGINKFADLSHEEFKNMLLAQRESMPKIKSSKVFNLPKDAEVPDSVDWREQGAVTKIKDQGDCGSCWAFAAVASFEGQYYLQNNELVDFSVQQVVDCADEKTYGVDGCGGGQRDAAFQYIADHGIERWDDYPYKASNNNCTYSEALVAARGSGFIDVLANDEEALKAAVATAGPVSIGINGDYIMSYDSGIYDDDCSPNIDHGVLAVGYGSENGVDYWIIKNSWGEEWGEKGYFKLARGSNLCCVSCKTSYPLL